MAMKSKNPEWHKIIRNLEEPRDTKNLAKKVIQKGLLFETDNNFNLREDWEDVKLEIMEAILYLKFTQNPDLKEKLLETKGHIEERNDWYDVFWGTYNGEGENHLGKLLMKIRNFLLEELKIKS